MSEYGLLYEHYLTKLKLFHNIQFIHSSIEKAEDYYKTIHIAPEQRTIIDSLIPLLSPHLPISDRAMKGFLWRVLKDYQMKRHMALTESANLSPKERIEGLIEILKMLKEALTRVLINQEQELKLDDAISKVITFYKERFASRYFLLLLLIKSNTNNDLFNLAYQYSFLTSKTMGLSQW